MLNVVKKAVLVLGIAGSALLLPGEATAVNVHISITGEILIPPCIVNSGRVIEVDFGDISTLDVFNQRFRQKKTIPVACSYSQGTPYVYINGAVLSGAPGNVLVSNIPNFGIALYQGEGVSIPMMLGKGSKSVGFQITSGLNLTAGNGTFTFTAAPYRTGSGELTSGAFTASASMSISYL